MFRAAGHLGALHGLLRAQQRFLQEGLLAKREELGLQAGWLHRPSGRSMLTSCAAPPAAPAQRAPRPSPPLRAGEAGAAIARLACVLPRSNLFRVSRWTGNFGSSSPARRAARCAPPPTWPARRPCWPGLWASQADDYPVTVKSGHSISEVIFSPREILYTGVTRPDALVLVSEEGLKQAGRYLRALTAESWLFVTPEFAGLDDPGPQGGLRLRGGRACTAARRTWPCSCSARRCVSWSCSRSRPAAEAIRRTQRSPIAEENLEVLAQSAAVVS